MEFNRGSHNWHRRDGVYRVRGRVSRQLVACSHANSDFRRMNETTDFSSRESDSTSFSSSRTEDSLSALPLQRISERKIGSGSTEMLVDEDMLTERKVRQNLPSVIEKLMGLEKLPPQNVCQKQQIALGKCLPKTPTLGFPKSHATRPNSVVKSFFQRQEYSDEASSIPDAKLSSLKPQSLSSRKQLRDVNLLVSPQQAKNQILVHGNTVTDGKSYAKKPTAGIYKEDNNDSFKRRSYPAIHRPSKHFNKSLSSSSVEIVKSMTRREVPKRLKMTDQHKEFGQKNSRYSENHDFGSSVVLKIINEKSARSNQSATQVHSSANIRQDSWKTGKFVNLPSPTSSLVSSPTSLSVAQSNKEVVQDKQHYSIKDILKLRARRLARTAEESSLKSDRSETSSDDTDTSGMEVEPYSPERCKPDRLMSPVSVLELQLKEDNTELCMQDPFYKSNDVYVHDYDASSGNTTETSEDSQLLLDAGFSEDEFMDIEERDYSYLLDMLIISGVQGVNQESLYSTGWVLKYPVEEFVFEKLEKKYCKVVSWSRTERRLFFDQINSILGRILAPCMDIHPWVRCNRKLAPMWGSEGIVEKVWEMLIREYKKMSVGKAEEKALDGIWLDLGNTVNELGSRIEQKILDELLGEFVSELI